MRNASLLLACLAVAALVYLASAGKVIFVPLLLILPLGWLLRRRR